MTTAMAGREKLDFAPPAYVGKPNVPPEVAVPDVTGMTEATRRTALGGVGFAGRASPTANDPTVPRGR